MRSLSFLIPGDLNTRTGGYGYDRRIIEGLKNLGWTVDVVQLDGSFPRPTAGALDDARTRLSALSSGTTVLIDGLALGAMPEEAARERDRLRLVALVHHPLAAETGIASSTASALETSERRALAAVRRVIVTSHATASDLASYNVEPARIAVVEPGTDRRPLARGSGSSTPHLLCVATIIPRKGHEVLIDALSTIPDREWRLTLAGSGDRDPDFAARVRILIERSGVGDRIDCAGELDGPALDRLYDASDMFVLPTWHEGYGMAVAEAIAHGLPVISTGTGAIPEIVGDAGVLLRGADADALSSALRRLIDDAGLRLQLRSAARIARERLPTWDDAARLITSVIDGV